MSKFKFYDQQNQQWVAFSETNQPAFSSIQIDSILVEAESPEDSLLFETDDYISIEPNDDGTGFNIIIDKDSLLQNYYNKTQIKNLLDNIEIYKDPLSIYKSNKDTYGIFTTIEYKRLNGTLYMKEVLSDGTSPKYETKTITYYDTDGTTVLLTRTYALTYDTDGDLISQIIEEET